MIDDKARKAAQKAADEFTDKYSCEGGGDTNYHGVPIREIVDIAIEAYLTARAPVDADRMQVVTDALRRALSWVSLDEPGIEQNVGDVEAACRKAIAALDRTAVSKTGDNNATDNDKSIGCEKSSDIAMMNMGTEKAVISSTEQEKLGTAPEAAGLEPRCAQPVPASNEYEIISKLSAITDKWPEVIKAIRPYLRTTEPDEGETADEIYQNLAGKAKILGLELRKAKPVSLEVCANAFLARANNALSLTGNMPSPREITKAVLDAAGVKYE